MVPEPPPAELAPSCAEAGVLGVLPGIIGSIQAIEAIKLLLDLGDPLSGRLLAYDSLEQSFRTFKVRRDPSARPAPSTRPTSSSPSTTSSACPIRSAPEGRSLRQYRVAARGRP